jgi:hypothetical protein
MKVPCKDCTKRVLGCHSWCPDYQKYHEENVKHNEEKLKETLLHDHSPSQAHRFKKVTIDRMRRGLK